MTKSTMILSRECCINPASGGFGEWQAGEYGEAMDEIDIIQAMAELGPIYELGRDQLPESIEDIRGKIHNQPERIFAIDSDFGVQYCGISENR